MEDRRILGWRRLGVVLLVLASLSVVSSFAFAAERIKNIKVNVELQDDGSAQVTQVWNVSTDTGTEFYIPMSNLRDMEIVNFTVKDESGRVFTALDSWDVDASFEQKAYKNGINRTGGGSLELCWGKGSYGDHVYTLNYTMTNMVQSFPDYDGFLVRFINDQMSPAPEHGMVVITRAGVEPTQSFVATETGVFGFGYYGYINVLDGKIIAETDEPMGSSHSMTLMVRLPKGLLHPVSVGSGTFADLENKAKKGSDYTPDKDNTAPKGYNPGSAGWVPKLFGFLSTAVGALVLLSFFLGFKGIAGALREAVPLASDYKKLAPKYKDLNYYRDLPLDNSLEATCYALQNAGRPAKDEDLMGAFFLKLIKDKAFDVQKTVEDRMFLGPKESTSIVLNSPDRIQNENELEFYKIIKRAAGADNILQEKELKKYAQKNYRSIDNWLSSVRLDGEILFGDQGGYTDELVKKLFGTRYVKKITDKGVQMISNALGFKKFLEDFTLIAEREAREVALWDGYLIFAALFGIADKVAKEMKRIYPDFEKVSELTGSGGRSDVFSTIYMANAMNRAMSSGYTSGKHESQGGSRSSGGGGSSSFGGGGGFSGGGSGGGSR